MIGHAMVDVAMIGAGQTKYGNHPFGLKGMWAEAAKNAFESVDKNFHPSKIDEAFIGSVAFGGSQLGNTAALLTEHSAMKGVSVRRVENACAHQDLHFVMLGWRLKVDRLISLLQVELKK